ncbi:unnamed protein product, partial [Brassica napus]
MKLVSILFFFFFERAFGSVFLRSKLYVFSDSLWCSLSLSKFQILFLAKKKKVSDFMYLQIL